MKRRNNETMMSALGMFIPFILVFGFLFAKAGAFDREAASKTYLLHGTFDGTEFVSDDGEAWGYDLDVLDHEAWEGGLNVINFYQYGDERLYKDVEPNTLVWVRMNDNASDDISDDFPELIAYDYDGMNKRWNEEFDAFIAESNKLYEDRQAVIDAFESYIKMKEVEAAIYEELYESFSEVEEWEVTRNGNNININVK